MALFAAVAGGWIAASAMLALPSIVVAPPLLVAALEWCTRGENLPVLALKRWTLLVLAAAVGAAASALCPVIESVGMRISAAVVATAIQLVAVGVVLLLLGVTREDVYPALAVALVPILIAPIPV